MAEEAERLSRRDRSPDVILDEIERTRADMHETVDALERRLSPGAVLDEVWRRVRASGAGGSDVVRDHPIPLALMGLGLGWLAVEQATRGRTRRRREETSGAGYGGVGYYEPQALYSRFAEEEDRDAGRVDRVKHRTAELRDQARHGAGRLQREQPLALGAITFGIGLAAGLAGPATRWEDDHVGRLSDRVKDEARRP